MSKYQYTVYACIDLNRLYISILAISYSIPSHHNRNLM